MVVTVREVGMHVLHLFAPVLIAMLAAGFNQMIVLILVVFVLDVSVACNNSL